MGGVAAEKINRTENAKIQVVENRALSMWALESDYYLVVSDATKILIKEF
jgi:hypothetical protein